MSLSTTLTGSMEAIHVGSAEQGDTSDKVHQSNTKQQPSASDESHDLVGHQSAGTGAENDSSVLNTSKSDPLTGVEKSHTRTRRETKDSATAGHSKNSVDEMGKVANKNSPSANVTKSNAPETESDSSIPRVKSVKRKRETEEGDNKREVKKEDAAVSSTSGQDDCDSTNSPAAAVGRATFFVKDWEFVQVLGEGAYGEVKLAYNIKTREAVAVKIVDTSEEGVEFDEVRKEVCIHRMISHKNVIKFYGVRREGDTQYLFLEYASGGELFDRIEPDVGMPQAEAQKYFHQLIDGLEYLHSKGIAHRDIKPENLLLDEKDDLKIADFGLATLFRYQDKWRLLERLCGSAPYLAPEVVNGKPYRAEPADIWSCGIVFVAMLGGELPWDAAVLACMEYVNWRECHIENKPWSKIDNLALCLLRRLLAEKPEKRYTIADIRKNQWFNKNFSKDRASQLSEGPLRLRARNSESDHSPGPVSCSQPNISRVSSDPEPMSAGSGAEENGAANPICFSQPVQADNMLLSSQLNATQSSQTPMQKLVRRMTRFFSKQSLADVTKELGRVFGILGYSWKLCSPCVLTVHTTDRRQSQLTFKAMMLEMGESLLVDFRLSKGDGLEFKRHFIRIREHMNPMICKVPPSWPNLPCGV